MISAFILLILIGIAFAVIAIVCEQGFLFAPAIIFIAIAVLALVKKKKKETTFNVNNTESKGYLHDLQDFFDITKVLESFSEPPIISAEIQNDCRNIINKALDVIGTHDLDNIRKNSIALFDLILFITLKVRETFFLEEKEVDKINLYLVCFSNFLVTLFEESYNMVDPAELLKYRYEAYSFDATNFEDNTDFLLNTATTLIYDDMNEDPENIVFEDDELQFEITELTEKVFDELKLIMY